MENKKYKITDRLTKKYWIAEDCSKIDNVILMFKINNDKIFLCGNWLVEEGNWIKE